LPLRLLALRRLFSIVGINVNNNIIDAIITSWNWFVLFLQLL
jgi:hypothetical protein